MRKNVKYLSAAAAALLTVAPIVAPVTNVFADSSSQSQSTMMLKAAKMGNEFYMPSSTAMSDLANLNAKPNAGTSFTDKQVVAMHGMKDGYSFTSMIATHNYYVDVLGTVGGLKPGQKYSFTTFENGQESKQERVAGQDGKISGVVVRILVHATSANVMGQPYWEEKKSGATIKNGVYYSEVQTDFPNTTAALLKDAESKLAAKYVDENGQEQNAAVITSTTDIANQLKAQGLEVHTGGVYDGEYISNGNYHITLTAINPANNQKMATVEVQYSAVANYKNYPVITYKASDGKAHNIKEGWKDFYKFDYTNSEHTVAYPVFTAGSAAAVAFRAIDNFTAFTNYEWNSTLPMQVVSNKVDPYTPGWYPVSVKATNQNGYTTDLTYYVEIVPALVKGDTASIHYVPGYNVNIWSIVNDGNFSYTGKQLRTGDWVTVGKTKTVNGISFTQISNFTARDNGKTRVALDPDANFWVETQYLSDAWKMNAAKPAAKATTTSKETPYKGVLTVAYNGLGGVRLLNGEGQYQDQYVKNGVAYKVYAMKTMNGMSYYKIGNDNQWIPAMYAKMANPSAASSMNGVLMVKYNGLGGVRLLNGAGEYQDQYVKNGEAYKVYAMKTMNGMTYYKIGNDNQWIPAMYAKMAMSNMSKGEMSSEMSMSGTVKVKYNGLGGVRLLNAAGEYQNQYVKNGEAYKVYAKKSMNGMTYYKIGNDNQWIPAMYAMMN